VLELTGRTAVVTRGASGIGAGVVAELQRRRERAQPTARAIRASGEAGADGGVTLVSGTDVPGVTAHTLAAW
jgi:hypothetical protein